MDNAPVKRSSFTELRGLDFLDHDYDLPSFGLERGMSEFTFHSQNPEVPTLQSLAKKSLKDDLRVMRCP